MRVAPFHSKRPRTYFYHNNNNCTEGKNIDFNKRRHGTDGHQLCKRCKELNAEDK